MSLLALGQGIQPNYILEEPHSSALWLAARRKRLWFGDLFGGVCPIAMSNGRVYFKPETNTEVTINDHKASEKDLVELWEEIAKEQYRRTTFQSTSASKHNFSEEKATERAVDKVLRREILDEISKGLSRTPLFQGRDHLLKELRTVSEDEYLTSIAGGTFMPVSDLEIHLGSSALASLNTPSSGESKPFVLAVGPGGVTTIAIAKYMKEYLHYPIEVDYHYANSQDITRSVLNNDFSPTRAEGIILSQVCSARLSKKRVHYRPFTLVPGTTNSLVTTRVKSNCISGSYSFLTDQESAATLIFNNLLKSKQIERSKSSIQHFEPGFTLSSETDFSILWWPYYRFNELIGKATQVSAFEDSFTEFSVFMFVHEQVLQDKARATRLSAAFKTAWLNLRLNPNITRRIVDEMIADRNFVNYLLICNGINDSISLQNLSQQFSDDLWHRDDMNQQSI